MGRALQTRRSPLRLGGISRGLLATLAAVALLGGVAYSTRGYWQGEEESPLAGALTHVVERGDFSNEVLEQGEVESSNSVEVRCLVKSRNSSGTAIIEVEPDGTVVKEGQVLVRLDSSALEAELLQQKILTNNALALKVQSENDFEAAQIARKEYLEGTFAQEEQTIESERFVAEEELRRAQQYATYSERLALRGYITGLQLEGDRFAVEKARNTLETARTKLRVLREYTRPKMLKQFDAAIATSEAKRKSETARYELELTNEQNITDQIAKCVIVAPAAGQVVHANTSGSFGGTDFVVEPGALVRERQTIIRLPDPHQMQVKARVNEGKIALVRPGQTATVRLSALPDVPLVGEVMKVNEYPEPMSRYGSQVKVYATFIRIENPPEHVRAGSSAAVQIQIERQANVVHVPVAAVFEHSGRTYSLVRSGTGFVPRAIELGSANEHSVVVKSGLAEGDEVVMNAVAFRSKLDLPAVPEPSGPVAPVAEHPRAAQPAVAASGSAAPQAASPQETKGTKGGRESPAAFAQSLFRELDANGNGIIEAGEIPGERAARLAAADTNGDGNIERAELAASLARRQAAGGESKGSPSAPSVGGGQ